ncbi:MAG: hypothetical protein CL609_17180 [Anaerolineaceae bacterium]|nr:hypothetical protein [Anaerolineaceae bacterium]
MKKLEIFFLGSFKIHLDGVNITDTMRTKKERAILAYLAEESTRVHPRESIAEFFWSDRPESYARMNLRQALLGIRKAFGGEEGLSPFLCITETTVRFKPNAAWSDTRAFNEYLQITKTHEHDHLHTCQNCVQLLEKASELYRGDFLDGLYLGNVTGFQEWVVFNRERHFHHMIEVIKTLSKVYYKRGNYDQAYWYAWRYVDLAPLEEGAHRLLMRLLALSGRRNAALQQYEYCKSIIQRELSIEPSPETKQLYTLIKNGLPLDSIDTGSLASSKVPTKPVEKSQPSPPPEQWLYDPVTQVPMGPLFMDRLQRAILRMDRAKQMVAVIVISVIFPELEEMSPEYKHEVDQHLVRRLVGTVRECDTVAILRDNQFALILEEIKEAKVISTIVEKIKKNVGAPILVQSNRVEVILYIGSSIYPRDGSDATGLLNQAEIEMRTARFQQPTLF